MTFIRAAVSVSKQAKSITKCYQGQVEESSLVKRGRRGNSVDTMKQQLRSSRGARQNAVTK